MNPNFNSFETNIPSSNPILDLESPTSPNSTRLEIPSQNNGLGFARTPVYIDKIAPSKNVSTHSSIRGLMAVLKCRRVHKTKELDLWQYGQLLQFAFKIEKMNFSNSNYINICCEAYPMPKKVSSGHLMQENIFCIYIIEFSPFRHQYEFY